MITAHHDQFSGLLIITQCLNPKDAVLPLNAADLELEIHEKCPYPPGNLINTSSRKNHRLNSVSW